MSYNFLNNGDVFAIGHDGENYVGRIDSEGDWRPESEEFENLEEYIRHDLRRELVCWASNDNPNWCPDSAHLTFAGIKNSGDDWGAESREWKADVKIRIIENATEEEKYDAGLLER